MTRTMEIQHNIIPYKCKPSEAAGGWKQDGTQTKHSASTDRLTTERQETQEANEGLVNLIRTITREGM